ncbi:hypothetical protein ACEWX3_02885 [Mycobacterium sp. G7A2]|uniref:hypothetical protein n=1 Tax=Mycobacteriaceae TaxID=1762 RepID=UPI0035A8E0C4
MNTAVTFLILTVAFTAAALLVRVARRSGSRRLHLDQFRMAAPMGGRLSGDDDPDAYRIRHDADAIRTRFEQHPHWPSSRVLGERR